MQSVFYKTDCYFNCSGSILRWLLW